MTWFKKVRPVKRSHYCRTPDGLGLFGIFGEYPGIGSEWKCNKCGTLWTMNFDGRVQGWRTNNPNAIDKRTLSAGGI